MEEKSLSVLGGPARLEARAGQGPSQAQVLAWVDEVFHDLRQNKVSSDKKIKRDLEKHRKHRQLWEVNVKYHYCGLCGTKGERGHLEI